ncbi:tyrosine-type recombinase/integrase [Gordonia sp. NPDC003950]
MAYIRSHETSQKRKGRAVKRYEVVWREPVRDDYGLPVVQANGKTKTRARQESFATREDAEARRDELNAARHSGQTSALAEQKKAGDLPLGHYAQAWIESQQVKVAQGRLKQKTLDGYAKIVRHYLLPAFGSKATAAITPKDCEDYLTSLVRKQSRQNGGEPIKPGTVKHAWNGLRRVMKYAMQHGAITSNPCDRVDYDGGRATGDREKFQHRPLSAEQVAQLSAAVAGKAADANGQTLPAYPEYALMVEFLAYSGLRAAENSGLEIGDLAFTTRPGPDSTTVTRCSVSVRRTKDRKGGEWITTTPKSRKSRRTVPLPPWLAEKLRQYVAAHPRANEPSAPLWPSRKNGGGYRAKGTRYAVPLDWTQPVFMGTFYDTILKPALEAVGLPARRPATTDCPAQHGVRLHDLRHTFAVMQLMAGVHFMQVSRWMGHSTFTLTLDTYGDWIPEEDGGALNDLPEPTAPESAAAEPDLGNVVQLFGR